MNFIFLMDPLHTVVMEKDTTFILMLGAHNKGHKVFFLPDGGITRSHGKTYFHVTEVVPQQKPEQPFIVGNQSVLNDDETDVLFIRNDPPFDDQYLHNTWLLDLLPEHKAVINSPSGIRRTNEKIWATQFTDITPPTLVGRNIKDLADFLNRHTQIVAKPTDGHGGRSVFYIKKGERNTNVILETLTHHGKKDIILQAYVPEAEDGDKRILLLNGEPLGAVLRVHSKEDHRNNFFSGGRPEAATITKNDAKIIEVLKPKLQSIGLYFVGIDVMGSKLIEVNVTSPTCLQEINAFDNAHLEDRVIEFAEKLVDQKKSAYTIKS